MCVEDEDSIRFDSESFCDLLRRAAMQSDSLKGVVWNPGEKDARFIPLKLLLASFLQAR